MRYVLWLAIFAVLGALAYVRLVPHDVERIHAPIEGREDADMAIGALRVMQADGATFEAAIAYLGGLPRTTRLAGDAGTGRITFVTRSKLFGFPDYTTVEFADGTLKLYARLRFGGSDLGVNRERLEGLIAAIQ